MALHTKLSFTTWAAILPALVPPAQPQLPLFAHRQNLAGRTKLTAYAAG